ncbi:uncharacterized protein LOC133194220 [Saccostrea echinata]|uniref:uncharacterized protein LOC133194220 n=1 Tax=Saccostrea echinata TaxID=191078 RepID=UPI002A82F3A1|nr:uncharacterized protein LOC133194220 [Saccostrea echinata]
MSNSKRKPNWSGSEIEALAQAVAENIRTVKGKFTPALTQDVKNKCWNAITERVNAVNDSRANRDTAEVKKKWQDLSSLTKKKEAERIKHRRVTGGGPAMSDHDVKPWEQLIIGTFSKSALEGVQGGIDTGTPTERETSYPFEEAVETTPAVDTCEETSEEFETGIFANSLPSADGAAAYPSIQNKKKRKNPQSNDSCKYDIRREFLDGEKEKNAVLEEYRKKKIALNEKIIEQQSEMIALQKRTATALEVIALRCEHTVQPSSPFSVSPIIHFNT